MDISLLLQALLQLLRRSPDGNDAHAVALVESSTKLDLLGTHGAPNVLGSVISLCDFVIDNPSQQLYCEESGVRGNIAVVCVRGVLLLAHSTAILLLVRSQRHRRIVRSVNVLVDYIARVTAALAKFPTGLRYCTHNDMLASDFYESLYVADTRRLPLVSLMLLITSPSLSGLGKSTNTPTSTRFACGPTRNEPQVVWWRSQNCTLFSDAHVCGCSLLAYRPLLMSEFDSSAEPTVQRSLVNKGIIQWLVARMQEQLGLDLIDSSKAVEVRVRRAAPVTQSW